MCLSNDSFACSKASLNPTVKTDASSPAIAGFVLRASATIVVVFSWLANAWFSTVAAFNETTAACEKGGHQIERIVSDHLVFQKSEQPRQDYYSGIYEHCTRPRCSYQKFWGHRQPWKSERFEQGETHGES